MLGAWQQPPIVHLRQIPHQERAVMLPHLQAYPILCNSGRPPIDREVSCCLTSRRISLCAAQADLASTEGCDAASPPGFSHCEQLVKWLTAADLSSVQDCNAAPHQGLSHLVQPRQTTHQQRAVMLPHFQAYLTLVSGICCLDWLSTWIKHLAWLLQIDVVRALLCSPHYAMCVSCNPSEAVTAQITVIT